MRCIKGHELGVREEDVEMEGVNVRSQAHSARLKHQISIWLVPRAASKGASCAMVRHNENLFLWVGNYLVA